MWRKKPQIPPEQKQELFRRIKPILAKELETDEVNIKLESKLVDDLEADSLDAVEIVMALEEEFELEIPDEDAEKMIIVKDIIVYLYNRLKENKEK